MHGGALLIPVSPVCDKTDHMVRLYNTGVWVLEKKSLYVRLEQYFSDVIKHVNIYILFGTPVRIQPTLYSV